MSTQILGEFLTATTHGRKSILAVKEAVAQVILLAGALPVLALTGMIVLEAARGFRDHGLSYYDAQVWATARHYQVPTIFSEDFQDGRRLEGITFVNPLLPDFVLERWT